MNPFQAVEEFHRIMKLTVGTEPNINTDLALRLELLEEEFKELKDALRDGDTAGAAKELIDLIYVAIGAAVTWGIPAEQVFDAVHRSNMTKTPGNTTGSGKLKKGPSYVPPDIAAVLAKRK
jgi:predicted HAD superfamily Cof-like phosphohydrolase